MMSTLRRCALILELVIKLDTPPQSTITFRHLSESIVSTDTTNKRKNEKDPVDHLPSPNAASTVLERAHKIGEHKPLSIEICLGSTETVPSSTTAVTHSR